MGPCEGTESESEASIEDHAPAIEEANQGRHLRRFLFRVVLLVDNAGGREPAQNLRQNGVPQDKGIPGELSGEKAGNGTPSREALGGDAGETSNPLK